MSFGEKLQAIRKKNHLTQEGLAGMLGVSRQAVSKWELGEGYPEVDKLMILSKKLNVSLDSLLGGENLPADFGAEKPSGKIRIFSPNEGVTIDTSRVMRSQQFKGGKNSPKFALYASDGNDMSFWGAQNTFLAWYKNLEDITKEIDEINKAFDSGEVSYTLHHSVKCKKSLLFMTMENTDES